jgi:hypothetical protein
VSSAAGCVFRVECCGAAGCCGEVHVACSGAWTSRSISLCSKREVNMSETDWAADVRKYAPDADEKAIAGIVRHCGIALRNRDSSLVSFSDREEVARVRESFLKKKLGLTASDEELDAAISAVGETMKADRTRNRVTVYYLLADRFGKLSQFA